MEKFESAMIVCIAVFFQIFGLFSSRIGLSSGRGGFLSGQVLVVGPKWFVFGQSILFQPSQLVLRLIRLFVDPRWHYFGPRQVVGRISRWAELASRRAVSFKCSGCPSYSKFVVRLRRLVVGLSRLVEAGSSEGSGEN